MIPENATYTAAEVKVLTEAALRLGRKEALEEAGHAVRGLDLEALVAVGLPLNAQTVLTAAAKSVRDLASQSAPDATSEPAGDPGYSDLPQDSQAVRSPQGGDAVDLVGRFREAVEAARVRRLAERKGDPS